MALFGISSFSFFFLHFSEETFASRRKKFFSLATPGAIVFHIRSNYGIQNARNAIFEAENLIKRDMKLIVITSCAIMNS